MRAVITAGGFVEGAFADAIGTPVKALAPFDRRVLLDVVIDACTASGIEGVAVVGASAVRKHLRDRDVRVIDADDDGGVNVLRALDAWPGERIVYLASDLPFARADAVRQFVAKSEPYALTMGIASTTDYDARFPAAPPYGLSLGGERLVNACAFVIAPEAVGAIRNFATHFFAARKSLIRMALLLGPVLCAKFALKRLSVAEIERHAQRRLRIPVAAVRDCDPGLCFDVDTLDEYRYACAQLG